MLKYSCTCNFLHILVFNLVFSMFHLLTCYFSCVTLEYQHKISSHFGLNISTYKNTILKKLLILTKYSIHLYSTVYNSPSGQSTPDPQQMFVVRPVVYKQGLTGRAYRTWIKGCGAWPSLKCTFPQVSPILLYSKGPPG